MPPPMGVSVHHLSTNFRPEVEAYAKEHFGLEKTCNDVKVYDIEDLKKDSGFIRQKGANIVCPKDGKLGVSYVDTLKGDDDVGFSTMLISYSWGNFIGEIIDALVDFCERDGLDTKRTYIWICCLCNNQHRIKEEIDSGKSVCFEEFRDIFADKVTGINNVLSLMTPWDRPIYLTRVWCIFEMFTAIEKNCELSIIMPPNEKGRLIDSIKSEGVGELLKVLTETRIENAQTTYDEDKKDILNLIESEGGFAHTNAKVNERMRKWVDETLEDIVKNMEKNPKNATPDLDNALLYYGVSLVYNNKGDYTKALIYSKKSLAIREKVLGLEDPDTAES